MLAALYATAWAETERDGLLVGVVPVAAVVRCLEGSQAFGAEVVHWPPGWEGSGLAEWACAAMVAREGSVWSIATLDGLDPHTFR